jgi:hypothetical protein
MPETMTRARLDRVALWCAACGQQVELRPMWIELWWRAHRAPRLVGVHLTGDGRDDWWELT